MMKGMAIILLFIFFFISTGQGTENVDVMAMRVYNAYLNNDSLPVLSLLNPDLTVLSAYSVQQSYVERRLKDDKIIGFKAGLTNKNSQNRFNVNMPVSGVLFASGKREAREGIDLKPGEQLMIETEIGLVVGKLIDRPITEISQLKKRIRSVVAAIEIPDLRFENMLELKGEDIIANNVSAYACILGETENHINHDLKKISLSLWREGELINKGYGSDVLGDPWQAALWLVNNTLSQGWVLEPGQVLLTGSMGKMLPAIRGKYVADFDKLGRISFDIR